MSQNIESLDQFNQVIKAEDKLTVICFENTWAQPCINSKPKFEEMATEIKDKKHDFFTVDCDELEDVQTQAQVYDLPSYLFYMKGKLLEVVKGASMLNVKLAIKDLEERNFERKRTKIFFIENPILDIQVSVPDKSLFEKYDLPIGGACLTNDKQQELFPEILKMENVEFIPGGCALNSARAANFILRNQQKYELVNYFGSIGKDDYGQKLEKALKDVKIKGNFYKDSGVPTGTCGVVVHEKERSLCANLSAACKYNIDHLNNNLNDLEDAKLIYSTSFFITSNFEALIQVGKYAAEKNVPMGFNLSAVFLVQFNLDEIKKSMEYVDYIFANEDEADKWAEVMNLEDKSRKNIAKSLVQFTKVNDKRSRVAIITQGKEPVIVAQQKQIEVQIKEYPVEIVYEGKLIDTNGAGDSFVGGFLSQLAQDKSLETCINAGIYLSREVVQQSGCQFPEKMEFKGTNGQLHYGHYGGGGGGGGEEE